MAWIIANTLLGVVVFILALVLAYFAGKFDAKYRENDATICILALVVFMLLLAGGLLVLGGHSIMLYRVVNVVAEAEETGDSLPEFIRPVAKEQVGDKYFVEWEIGGKGTAIKNFVGGCFTVRREVSKEFYDSVVVYVEEDESKASVEMTE